MDDDDRDYSYMVLPLLRLYDYPNFNTVDEVVEFMRQILEASVSQRTVHATDDAKQGLRYMHRLNVAHR